MQSSDKEIPSLWNRLCYQVQLSTRFEPQKKLPRLMGKVASDKRHKWVFKEPTECEPNISNYRQSSFDVVADNYYKPDMKKKATFVRLSFVLRSLKVAKSSVKRKNRQA